MGGECNMNGEKMNAYRREGGEPKGKRPRRNGSIILRWKLER
jgi:hypothetical protein